MNPNILTTLVLTQFSLSWNQKFSESSGILKNQHFIKNLCSYDKFRHGIYLASRGSSAEKKLLPESFQK